MKKFLTGAGVFIAILLLLLAGGWLWLRSSGRALEGELQTAGLREPAEIWRDSLGVPHIWAGSVEDLLFAQGFVHAQDRLWQMEMMRRVAEGRLAEALGAQALESDKFLRTIGIWRAAAAADAALDSATRHLLDSYARGVNAAVAARRGALPPEFVALRIRPEPWTVRHILAIERIMAWDLSLYQSGLQLSSAVRRLGSDRARVLFPAEPDWGATILDPPAPAAVPAAAAALLDAFSITRASNSWVIGGRLTRSGKPILANDMHLSLRAPSLWHLMALHGGGLDVVGMTLPGAPFVVAGHNRAIAWGFTNAMVDDVDFFIERADTLNDNSYLTATGSERFRTVVDSIRVKGQDTAIEHVTRITRHGPIINAVEAGRAGTDLLAMRWIAHDSTRTMHGLRKLNAARNWSDFATAVADFDNPHQNVIYADTAGNFGYWMAGRVPIRGGGRRPPIMPVPGWTGEWDWTGELAIDLHPHVLNPPQGFIVTANNRQSRDSTAARITGEWMPPFRAMRIQELLTSGATFGAGDVQRQQMDLRDAHAARYRDRAVDAARAAGLDAAARQLAEWDLEARTDSRGAALYYLWLRELRRAAAADLYQDPAGGWFPDHTLRELLERRAALWGGAADGSLYARLAIAAARGADSIAAGRTWGEIHFMKAAHTLSSVAVLERAFDLDLGPVPAGGSPNTVNVSHYSERNLPFVGTYGASQRHVVDLADIDGDGGFILPTGQSGIPFSPHYRDQFDRYRSGGLWLIPLDRQAAEARTVQKLILRPQ